MHFQRLRLSGFKSFVEPIDFRIEPGLTGIVGPNGCGKSNLLEALRWVMGATSAKALRGEGMDDVIFGGTGARPPRNHAEVLLQIDNADRRAPAQFNHHPVLEVVRRIDRGQGSTYRINGTETRARDVQLLFADASTGANSPSLVRQGQISELIAAKPSNRRRILEEAAGVSGLHSRRHEADLRLKAAEANLERLDDVARELETTLNRLKREARQAEKYKRVSAEIRALQGAALYVRWTEARDHALAARAALTEAEAEVGRTTAAAASGTTAAADASESLKPLREEEIIAAAVLQRLTLERDRVEREEAQAKAEAARLEAELARIETDRARERQMADDAKASLERIGKELAEVERAVDQAPERIPALEAALQSAETARAGADAEVERLASEVAAEAARRQAARARIEDAEARRRGAANRLADAEARAARAAAALKSAEAERANLGPAETPEAADAARRLGEAEAAAVAAREALAAAEAAEAAARKRESEARDQARKAEDEARRLKTEADGLAALTLAPAKGGFAPALNAVSPDKGYEAALAAALGDDLDAALDAKAPAYWGGATAETISWPEGVAPLAPLVRAPAELAARLALTGLVDRADGARLQALIPRGARLVSKEGDLWRWDGFVARAEAPKPAAKRLAQKNRLTELQAQLSEAQPAASERAAEHRAAAEAVREAETSLREARKAVELADRARQGAREAVERYAREQARIEALAQALADTIARLSTDTAEAEAAVAPARADLAESDAALTSAKADAPTEGADASGLASALASARAAAAQAREAASEARSRLDGERRAREGRLRRKESLARDLADWGRRARDAEARAETLDRDALRAAETLETARAAPAAITARRLKLMDEYDLAEARRRKAADALAAAEAAAADADRAARQADQRAAAAREARAAAAARLEAADERLTSALEQLREATRLEPEALAARLAEEANAIPSDPVGLETLLRDLERQRDSLGAVNLRAEEEASEHALRLEAMISERADLTGAIARLRGGIEELNGEGRERLLAAFDQVNESFKALFEALFAGGQAELRLVESDDPLEAGLEIFACPPGKRLAAMSLMSGGEQALTATALIFAVFLANPAPVCVLDEVDAPLDDANVDRFCRLLDEMRRRTDTRFIAITHNPVTMSRMDRLFGVTMQERGVSQLVSVDLRQAEALAAE
jgi:chromosome segregation protein